MKRSGQNIAYTDIWLKLESDPDNLVEWWKTYYSILSEDDHLDLARFCPNINLDLLLELASKYGSYTIVKSLLDDKYINPASNNQKALLNAIAHNHINIVRLFLSKPEINP